MSLRPPVNATPLHIVRQILESMVGPMCLRDAACLRQTCLREASSRRHASSLELSSKSVCACPHVFATPRVFAGPVFRKRLRLSTYPREATCLRRTFLREVSSLAHVPSLHVGASLTWLHCGKRLAREVFPGSLRTPTCLCSNKCLCRERVFRRPRFFAVLTWHVSADAQVSSKTVLGSLSPKPQVSSKHVFGLGVICAPSQANAV